MAKAKQAKATGNGKASVPKYFNYIGGEWVRSASNEWFENVNPADTTDIVGRFPVSNDDDVNNAVEAAKSAATKWRLTPAPKRAEILFKLGEILRDNKDEFTRQMTREMGKVLKESGGDVQEAIDCTYYTAGEGRRLHGFTTPAEMKDKFAMCVRQPVGICGLITPFNFPMAIPSWKLIPALVCGNTVVLKSGEDVPLSALNIVKACEKAGIPKGVVNLINGHGSDIGPTLVGHPDVRLI
jgi:aldehyde dehydrogenase (NAD+)